MTNNKGPISRQLTPFSENKQAGAEIDCDKMTITQKAQYVMSRMDERTRELFNLEHLWDSAEKNGFVTYDQIRKFAPRHVIEANKIDKMVLFFTNLGFLVCEQPPKPGEFRRNPELDKYRVCQTWVDGPDSLTRGSYRGRKYLIIREFLSPPGYWKQLKIEKSHPSREKNCSKHRKKLGGNYCG